MFGRLFNQISNSAILPLVTISIAATATTIFAARNRARLNTLPIKQLHPLPDARTMEKQIGLPSNSIRDLKQKYEGIKIQLSKDTPRSVIQHIAQVTETFSPLRNIVRFLAPILEKEKSFVIPDPFPYEEKIKNLEVHEFKHYLFRSMNHPNTAKYYPQSFQTYFNDETIRPYITAIDHHGFTDIEIICENGEKENIANVLAKFENKMKEAGLQVSISGFVKDYTPESVPTGKFVCWIGTNTTNEFNRFLSEYEKIATFRPAARR